MRVWQPFDAFEFNDRFGRIREVHGCSTAGCFEFSDRLAELWEIIHASADRDSIPILYEWDKRFRFLVDRCLELNGIDPDCLTPPMVTQLLFKRETPDGPGPGWLVEINQSNQEKAKLSANIGNPETTLDQIIASIATHTEDIEKAMHLANEVPGKDLAAVLGELKKIRDEQAHPEKAQARKYKAQAKANIKARKNAQQSAPV